MTTITLDLPPDLYRRLNDEAIRMGKSIETVAGELLAGQLATAPLSERDRATEVLRTDHDLRAAMECAKP